MKQIYTESNGIQNIEHQIMVTVCGCCPVANITGSVSRGVADMSPFTITYSGKAGFTTITPIVTTMTSDRAEFTTMGVNGDGERTTSTMTFDAKAQTFSMVGKQGGQSLTMVMTKTA